jgi:hypothetical protein
MRHSIGFPVAVMSPVSGRDNLRHLGAQPTEQPKIPALGQRARLRVAPVHVTEGTCGLGWLMGPCLRMGCCTAPVAAPLDIPCTHATPARTPCPPYFEFVQQQSEQNKLVTNALFGHRSCRFGGVHEPCSAKTHTPRGVSPTKDPLLGRGSGYSIQERGGRSHAQPRCRW